MLTVLTKLAKLKAARGLATTHKKHKYFSAQPHSVVERAPQTTTSSATEKPSAIPMTEGPKTSYSPTNLVGSESTIVNPGRKYRRNRSFRNRTIRNCNRCTCRPCNRSLRTGNCRHSSSS